MNDALFFFERAVLQRAALDARGGFAEARPFRHAVIDDVLPLETLNPIARAFPGPDHPGFRKRDYPQQRRFGQLQRRAFEGVDPVVRHLLNEVNGMVFVRMLETLSGVRGLIPDPAFIGAGLHLTLPGGHLALHADFDRDSARGLARRLSVVLFLVEEWDASWGGHLEFWDANLERREVRVIPRPGRLVVFEHGDDHWHGHPEPLACPEGVARQTLAAYYYVADGRPDADGHARDLGGALPGLIRIGSARRRALVPSGRRRNHRGEACRPPKTWSRRSLRFRTTTSTVTSTGRARSRTTSTS